MPYTIASSHRDYFLKNGYLELEEVLSEKEIDQLLLILRETLQNSLKKKVFSAKEAFLGGRDLLRKHPEFIKKLFSRNFVDLIETLFEFSKIRFGFDHYYHSNGIFDSTLNIPVATFQEGSAVSPIKAVLAIALSPITQDSEQFPPLPKKKGNVSFYKPNLIPNFPLFFEKGSGDFLLIGLGSDKILYRHESRDPFLHHLKKEDYAFGDLLKSDTHPFLKGSS